MYKINNFFKFIYNLEIIVYSKVSNVTTVNNFETDNYEFEYIFLYRYEYL